MKLPDTSNIGTLEDALSAPYPEDIAFAGELTGDVLVLGAGGKMGPTLVQRICRAREAADQDWTVYAVSRYSDPKTYQHMEQVGAQPIRADLLDEAALTRLPACPHIIYMTGMKFGTTGQEPLTWAVNSYLPGRIAEQFPESRMMAFSTGNVYPLVPVDSGGSKESDPPAPVGEYAQSCLGRERVFEYFSSEQQTPVCLFRLNYAVEARYGVLLDIAQHVYHQQPLSLDTGYVNVIWQGDANSYAFRALQLCDSPPRRLNVTGPDILAVRDLARQFGEHFGVQPQFIGAEQDTALLSDASACHSALGSPKVPVEEVIDLVASWVKADRPTWHKPTKFEVRSGNF
jgi:nucleoside-diphosphate-sugar epimerase